MALNTSAYLERGDGAYSTVGTASANPRGGCSYDSGTWDRAFDWREPQDRHFATTARMPHADRCEQS